MESETAAIVKSVFHFPHLGHLGASPTGLSLDVFHNLIHLTLKTPIFKIGNLGTSGIGLLSRHASSIEQAQSRMKMTLKRLMGIQTWSV